MTASRRSSHLLVVLIASKPLTEEEICAEVSLVLRAAGHRGIQVSGLPVDDQAFRAAHREGYIEAVKRYAGSIDELAEMKDYHERHGWK